MTSRRTLGSIALGFVAAVACAASANAYTYVFVNGSNQTVTQIWLHTQSAFCHDVTWRGNLPSGGNVKITTASICLVDRVEVLNGPSWSSATGHASGIFAFNNSKVCFRDIGVEILTGAPLARLIARC